MLPLELEGGEASAHAGARSPRSAWRACVCTASARRSASATRARARIAVRRTLREGPGARLVRAGLDDHRARERRLALADGVREGDTLRVGQPLLVASSRTDQGRRTMTTAMIPATKPTFREALREQRWDDHRFYHHSRVNQSLHLFSACCFLTSYALLAFDHGECGVGRLGRCVDLAPDRPLLLRAEGLRRRRTQMSHEQKEDVKVGYNLTAQVMLLAVFLAAPVVLYALAGSVRADPPVHRGRHASRRPEHAVARGGRGRAALPHCPALLRPRRPDRTSSGSRRSSRIRSTTCARTGRRRTTCVRGELIDPELG